MQLTPPHLRKGDLIALIAPASTPVASERIDGGVKYLERLGYSVVAGKHALDVNGYLAGTDEARLEDLNGFIRDKRVKAIIAIRGGYGTPRLLRGVDYAALKKNPKIIVGYSDITGLQLAIFKKTGLITFSGPMSGVEMWKEIDPYTEEHFWKMIGTPAKTTLLKNPDEEPVRVLKAGSGTGRLIGGNFSLLMSLMGTPYCPSMKGVVLLAEDVDEAPHRIDRMLAHLRNAGYLRSAAGMLFGKFSDCVPSDPSKPHLTVDQVIAEYAKDVGGPVLANVQYGHIPKKLTMPLGAKCRIDGAKGSVEIVESVVK
ncbi:MAG TPA: LD-carboxypeptidase [Bacteroidetes bacterium]|nr:LD-carboxypeptidase [Bacteroidota bacterium]